MTEVDTFDQEILAQINKKQAIEAMSGIYSHLPPALIEQVYDFCNDSKMAEYNEYIYLQDNYNQLSANQLKKYYKLHNKMIKQFKDLPHHAKYGKDEVLPQTIEVIENRPTVAGNSEFIPDNRILDLVYEEPTVLQIPSGRLQ